MCARVCCVHVCTAYMCVLRTCVCTCVCCVHVCCVHVCVVYMCVHVLVLLSIRAALLDEITQHLHGIGMFAAGLHVLFDITSETKGQLLPGHLIHDPLGVVVPQPSTQFVVVHLWLVLLFAPQPSNLVRLNYPELVLVTCPVDHAAVVLGEEEVQ